jgi:hypothetical protein
MFAREGAWQSVSRDTTPVETRTVPMQIGMPRTVLGAWHSEPQLRRAVAQYDGWMGSGGPGTHYGGWRDAVGDAIKRYRDMGGGRALITTVLIDLSQPEAKLDEEGSFHLACGPKSAAERIRVLEDMGYDDLILIPIDRDGRYGDKGFTAERLEEIRSLLPRDGSDYHIQPTNAAAGS